VNGSRPSPAAARRLNSDRKPPPDPRRRIRRNRRMRRTSERRSSWTSGFVLRNPGRGQAGEKARFQPGTRPGFVYSATANPTLEVLEDAPSPCTGRAEGCHVSPARPGNVQAVFTAHVQPPCVGGDHVGGQIPGALFGSCFVILASILPALRHHHRPYFRSNRGAEHLAAVGGGGCRPRLTHPPRVFLETAGPTRPLISSTSPAAGCRKPGPCRSAPRCSSTTSSPRTLGQKPLELGADVVALFRHQAQSTAQGRVLGGGGVGGQEVLDRRLLPYYRPHPAQAAVSAVQNAWCL